VAKENRGLSPIYTLFTRPQFHVASGANCSRSPKQKSQPEFDVETEIFRAEELHSEIVKKWVFLQRQRKSEGLRAFAQSLSTAGLDIVFLRGRCFVFLQHLDQHLLYSYEAVHCVIKRHWSTTAKNECGRHIVSGD